jgi:uncharacterized protein (UPF0332 family)
MAFEWEDYLVLAEDLSTDNDEAALRSAVSRAYYAAFNIARDFLSINGFVVSENKASVHHEVWNEYERRGDTWATVYKYGDALKKQRRDADYILKPRPFRGKPKNWSEEVKQSIHGAEMVLYWVGQLAGGGQGREN